MGHIWQADGRLMKRILSKEIEDTTPWGRPRRGWLDNLQETMMELTQSQVDWNISKNNNKWNDLVSAPKSRLMLSPR